MRATTISTWNNSESFEDGFSSMKHFKRCSNIIPKSPFENKWGIMAKAWANRILFRTKV